VPGPNAEPIDRVFHALAHPVRRGVLRQIAQRECSVSELAEPFDMTLEAVSQHIRVLERAGLLRRTRRGRVHACRLDPAPLSVAAQMLAELARFWGTRLDGLERYLRETLEQN
jgi:DNA-binding transcriptional ArsR family regulator